MLQAKWTGFVFKWDSKIQDSLDRAWLVRKE